MSRAEEIIRSRKRIASRMTANPLWVAYAYLAIVAIGCGFVAAGDGKPRRECVAFHYEAAPAWLGHNYRVHCDRYRED
jgi:hypothetical protein